MEEQENNPKNGTRKLTLRNPIFIHEDEKILRDSLGGRELSAELVRYLFQIVRDSGIEKKINIPKKHNNAAVALVRSSFFGKEGLSIFDHLHIFYDGKVFIEKWKLPKNGHVRNRPHFHTLLDIHKVHICKYSVVVELKIPQERRTGLIIREYDFLTLSTWTRETQHPLE